MSPWRQLARGLRTLLNRRAADRDIADEVQSYFEQAIAARMASGLSFEEARRVTRLEFGHTTNVREQVRSYGWENLAGTLLADLRYTVRRLRNSPGFTAVGALTLALGIGASTAIFSAVNPVLFESLPYPHAGSILMIWDMFQGSRADVTFHTFREVIARSRSFEAISVTKSWQPAMTGVTHPERLEGESVSANYFRVLGVQPVLGRSFQESDDQFEGPHVVILSDRLWRRRFSGDKAIVGHQITLDDRLYTVIGVMPREFENVLAPSAELWSPLQYDPRDIANTETREWGHHLRMLGRLRPGVRLDQAEQELNLIARTPEPEYPRPPWASLRSGLIINSLQDEIARGVKPAMLAVVGAVVLLLMIASVNVTSLLLARAAQQRGEYAMRAALGAGRSRMVRQLLTESLLLAIIGGTLGIVVAEAGLRTLVALSPPELPRVTSIALDGTAFAFAFGVTTFIGLAVGLVPALYACRDLQMGLQQSSKRTVGGHQSARRMFIVAEVALALVLLVSAGLLLRSVQRLFAVEPGFNPSHLLTMQVQESGHRFEGDSARRQFFTQALDQVQHVPGVASAAFTSLLPLSGDLSGAYGLQFEDRSSYNVFRYVVTPGYFKTMGIALRRGRLLDAHDTAITQPAVLISESLAKHKFPYRGPVGQRVHVGPAGGPWYTIVGVVGDVKQTSLAGVHQEAVYITTAQSWFVDTMLSLVVRAHGNVAALAPPIENGIWSVDKDQPIVRVMTMDDLFAASESQRRFVMLVFEAFALAALALAATGIYGVLSGSVTERTRELGVRSALGASRGNIVALVLREGMTLTGCGVLIGLGGAAAATQSIVTLLFGVSRLDPITYFGVIALLVAVSNIACWAPAWRAARVDPSRTLRAE